MGQAFVSSDDEVVEFPDSLVHESSILSALEKLNTSKSPKLQHATSKDLKQIIIIARADDATDFLLNSLSASELLHLAVAADYLGYKSVVTKLASVVTEICVKHTQDVVAVGPEGVKPHVDLQKRLSDPAPPTSSYQGVDFSLSSKAQCNVCIKEGNISPASIDLKPCMHCQCVHYCSRAHRLKDLKVHSTLCDQVQELREDCNYLRDEIKEINPHWLETDHTPCSMASASYVDNQFELALLYQQIAYSTPGLESGLLIESSLRLLLEVMRHREDNGLDSPETVWALLKLGRDDDCANFIHYWQEWYKSHDFDYIDKHVEGVWPYGREKSKYDNLMPYAQRVYSVAGLIMKIRVVAVQESRENMLQHIIDHCNNADENSSHSRLLQTPVLEELRRQLLFNGHDELGEKRLEQKTHLKDLVQSIQDEDEHVLPLLLEMSDEISSQDKPSQNSTRADKPCTHCTEVQEFVVSPFLELLHNIPRGFSILQDALKHKQENAIHQE